MANIKQTIDDNIYQNGQQRITGVVMNSVLKAMVDDYDGKLSELATKGYKFGGVVSPTDSPIDDTLEKMFYIANGRGAYPNFDSIEVDDTKLTILLQGETATIQSTLSMATDVASAPNAMGSGWLVVNVNSQATFDGKINKIKFRASSGGAKFYLIVLSKGEGNDYIIEDRQLIETSESGVVELATNLSISNGQFVGVQGTGVSGENPPMYGNAINDGWTAWSASAPASSYPVGSTRAMSGLSNYSLAFGFQIINAVSAWEKKEVEIVGIGGGTREKDYTFADLTSHDYYNMNNGSYQGNVSQYNSLMVNIPSWAKKIKAQFDGSNSAFGIILFNGTSYVYSWYATPSIEVNLENYPSANRLFIQSYYSWTNTKVQIIGEGGGQEEEITYTTITATRNASDFNSIREIVSGITDASYTNRYIIKVPKGEWFECDLRGKKYVSIVGEDREQTILYCDGQSTNIVPSGYHYPAEVGKQLKNVSSIYKHCIFASDDLDISNLTIRANDAKYCLHLDDVGFENINVKNCHIITLSNMNEPIGIGLRGEQTINIEGCIIERKDGGNRIGIYSHNWNNQTAPSRLNVRDTYFKCCGFARISELGSNQDDEWSIINCYSDCGGAINFAVEGESVTDPLSVPYCIKLNCSGSNVGKIQKNRFEGTTTIARPNIMKYIIADCILAVPNNNYLVDGQVNGYITSNGVVIADVTEERLPFLGVVDSIIDGVAYIIKKGNSVIVPLTHLYGSIFSIGTLVYRRNNGYLTTLASQSWDNVAVGIIWGDFYGVGRQIALF